MHCVCDAIEPDFLSEGIAKARKGHHCYECGETISVGERYHRVSGKWDGRVESFTTCLECMALRQEIQHFACGKKACICVVYGSLYDEIEEAKESGWSEDWCLRNPPLQEKQ